MSQNLYHKIIESPVGTLKLMATDKALVAIKFVKNEAAGKNKSTENSILAKAADQLAEYFSGKRKSFDLPLLADGTTFERKVWDTLNGVGYGTTVTYSKIAKKLGDINKVRAVGKANGQNPIPIIIPCHRVIGANNKLTGYAGGIERKRWLLQHEGALLL